MWNTIIYNKLLYGMYILNIHRKVEYVCTPDGRKITSVLTGLVGLGGAATKPVGPGFDGSEPAARRKGIK